MPFCGHLFIYNQENGFTDFLINPNAFTDFPFHLELDCVHQDQLISVTIGQTASSMTMKIWTFVVSSLIGLKLLCVKSCPFVNRNYMLLIYKNVIATISFF